MRRRPQIPITRIELSIATLHSHFEDLVQLGLYNNVRRWTRSSLDGL